MIRRKWPVALVALFVALLGWYLLYTERIVEALRADAATLTRIFAEVNEGLADPSPGSADQTLTQLQRLIIEVGVPLILTGPGDTVLAVENLPFEANLDTPAGQARIRDYIRRLDLRHPPVGDPELQHVHFGDPPDLRRLRWIPWLQAGGLLLTMLVGATVIRYQWRAEGERAWTAMARELAHQLGTPLSSLQGWLEVMKLPHGDRPGSVTDREVAQGVEEDLERLERVSRRFELIGRTPSLEGLDLHDVLQALERYLQTRLPRIGPGVALEVDAPPELPRVQGNDVLLTWALENVVKNSLDALAGRGGSIRIRARRDSDRVVVTIRDTGPGVAPEVRDRIFEAGVSSKAGGWGVGLTLSRRIIEGLHGGRIELVESGGEGAAFEVKLPVARG